MSVAKAFFRRLLVSVALLILIGGFGIVYGDIVGPSKIGYGASIVLIAWPWTLPQIFVVLWIVEFVFQQLRRKWRKPFLGVEHFRRT